MAAAVMPLVTLFPPTGVFVGGHYHTDGTFYVVTAGTVKVPWHNAESLLKAGWHL